MILDQILGRGKARAKAPSNSSAAGLTDVGCERDKNEDRFAVVESACGTGFFVFDGMGGEAGGEAAAQLSVDAIQAVFAQSDSEDGRQLLRSAIERAHQVISLRRQNQVFAGMGTTVVAAMISGPEITIASVGDSRAYLIHDGTIQQLTSDHTYVQELVDQGHIQPQDALVHPQAHILTRCVGATVGFQIDSKALWIWPSNPADSSSKDVLLLCSDGLYSLISESEMADIATTHSSQDACEHFVKLARQRGGFDNITALIIPIDGVVKTEAPEGSPVVKRPQKKRKHKRETRSSQAASKHRSWGFHAVMVSFLCVAASLTTAVGFVFVQLMGE